MPDDAASQTESLEQLLHIMDVASTLRRERERASQQLDQEARRKQLRERLLATAAATGERLTEAEVDAAIQRYYATQYVYADPPFGWRVAWAHAYVRRGRIMLALLLLVAALVVVWWLWWSPAAPLSSSGRAERQWAATVSDFGSVATRARALASGEAARREVAQLVAGGERLADPGQREQLLAVTAQLRELADQLDLEYRVQIVSGGRSGVERSYTDDDGTRISGYYLVVQARAADGAVIARQIANAERDGRLQSVTKWAELVPKQVYDQVAADKRRDGIVDRHLFAEKRRGELAEVITLFDDSGFRRRQITEW